MTNNKQQTAVEWLQSIELQRDLTLADWKQAKEMENKQIIDAWISDRQFIIWSGDKDEFTDDEINELANEYYNKTYGGGEQ
jgi:hypothetical protein